MDGSSSGGMPPAADGPAPLAEPAPLVVAAAPADLPPAAVAAPVWPKVGAVLSGSLDLVTQARIPLRNASLYIGLLGVLTMALTAMTLLAPGVDLFSDPPEGIGGWTVLAVFVSFLAVVAIGVESEIIGVAILGGARIGQPLSLREALRRSRQVFWRVLWATFAVGLIGAFLSGVLQAVFGAIFGNTTDAAPVGSALLAGVITAPFIYVPVGIVLGDVGAMESIRRSIRLARARFRLAVVASLFSVVAQFILVFAASAGIDLVIRVLEPFRSELEQVDTANAGGFLLVGVRDDDRDLRLLDPHVHGQRADVRAAGRRLSRPDRLFAWPGRRPGRGPRGAGASRPDLDDHPDARRRGGRGGGGGHRHRIGGELAFRQSSPSSSRRSSSMPR